ncbi:MAG: COG1615 family transporter [archaeon]|nr:COG1615 family transporter [archaeon]
MAKNSCEKHKRYVYNCRDCRIANNESVIDKPDDESIKDIEDSGLEENSSKRRYLDASIEDFDEENNLEENRRKLKEKRKYISSEEKISQRSNRFVYKRPPSNKLMVQIFTGVVIAALIIAIIVVYGIPSWWARIDLQNQLYANKADIAAGNTFWSFLVLNFYSTSFIINWVGLLGALIGCIIMSLPPDKNFIAIIGTKLGWGRPSNKKALIFWWTGGFLLFYFFGQLIDGFSNFGLTMYMINAGTISPPSSLFLLPLAVMNNLEIGMEHIFVYSNLYLPIIIYLLSIVAFRIILKILKVFYLERNDYLIGSYICFLISDFILMYFFSIPMNSYDAVGLIQLWMTPFGFFGFIGLGVFFRFFLYKQAGKQNFVFRDSDIKRTSMAVIILIIVICAPLAMSAPTVIGLGEKNNWLRDQWNIQTSKQIEWTRVAAGLDMFQERDISNLTDSNPSNLLKTIRQYDKEIAIYQMHTTTSNPHTLADSDIVFVGGQEYWVAPKTLMYNEYIADNARNAHTNLFDHAEGFVALNTFNGSIISNMNETISIFGVNNTHPIFFGEHESETLTNSMLSTSESEEMLELFGDSLDYYGTFDDDILLNTGWGEGESAETDYNYTYQGIPDGSLTGLPAFWFTMELGLTSYALNTSFEKEFLINRNIKDRIRQILLPGLWIDDDPYLVFDPDNGKMHYAISICTNLPMQSYSQSNILRYLGVALIDCANGNIKFVRNPMITSSYIANDPTYNLWKIYLDKYNWKSVSDSEYSGWLDEQIRYPEQLFEIQLSYQYQYYIDDPEIWYKQTEFLERPKNGDVFYVEFDIGEGPEFVGVEIVQRRGETETLAGMFVLRQGANFGECIFYKSPAIGENIMIGPTKAQEVFESEATTELSLIAEKDWGNILLYPIANSLYYYIPVYSGTENYQSLVKGAFINAFDQQDVVWGSDADDAYSSLNYSELETFSDGNVSITYEITDSPNLDYKAIELSVDYTDLNLSSPIKDIIVNISIKSDVANITYRNEGLTYCNFTYDTGKTGMNFTIIEEPNFGPGDGIKRIVALSAEVENVLYIGIEYKIVLIIDGEIHEYPSDDWDSVLVFV